MGRKVVGEAVTCPNCTDGCETIVVDGNKVPAVCAVCGGTATTQVRERPAPTPTQVNTQVAMGQDAPRSMEAQQRGNRR